MSTPSIEEILELTGDPSNRRVTTARVLLRKDAHLLLARHEELEDQIGNAPAVRSMESANLEKERDELADQIEAESVEFKFRSVGHRKWTDLLRAHPPKSKNAGYRFDDKKFPAAAVAATCVEPEMTLEQAIQLEDGIDSTQWAKLFNAASTANEWSGDLPKSRTAKQTLGLNGESKPQPTTFESPAPSSSGDA